MLTIHDRSATEFTGTGLGVLDPHVIEARVVEELNGQYALTLVYPADGPLAEHVTLEAIIAAPVPGIQQRQGFRIHEVTTTLDGLLEVTAFHVFYDLAGNFIADTFVVNKSAKAALDQLLAAATTQHAFTATSSDTATRASARLVRTNLAAALMDTSEDNAFLSRWGGELSRENWHIHHAARRGQDRGVVIRDRKNLTGYESLLDLTSVVTRIVPVGYDGITLPELYVDSPKLSEYVTPRIRVIRYPNIKAIKDAERPREDEVPLSKAHELLREAAAAEFSRGHIDEPTASYEVSFVELASTREYEEFAQLETVLLGDTVTVRHTDLMVSLSARVVSCVYDPLAGSYISVELGSTAAKFTSVTKEIKSAVAEAGAAADLAGVALASADGKTTNHYGPEQPKSARLGDTWFKTNGENTEIWVYQITDTGQPGWVAIATDLNHAQVEAELDAARKEVEAAKAAAGEARAAADAVAVRMTTAETELTEAREAADDAARTASEVQAAADALATRLTDAEADLAGAATKVSGVESSLEQVTAQARGFASELDSLDSRLDGVDRQVTGVVAQAQSAHNQAVAAKTTADMAVRDAAAAAGIAGTKADVLIQSTVPAVAMRKASTLWIDTTGGANTPKRWNGNAWLAITDKTAVDAAAKAASATTAASAAKERADAAYTLADSKPSDAEVKSWITTSANGKNAITLAATRPSRNGSRPGDTWWWRTGTAITGQWTWDGTAWVATMLRHEVIASVDVNTLLVTGSARMKQAVVEKIIGDAAHFHLLTADKLLIGTGANLIPNGDIAAGLAPWDAKLTVATDSPPPGYTHYLTTKAGQGNITSIGGGIDFPVTPGQTYAFEVWLKADKPGSVFYLELRNQHGVHAGTAGAVVNPGDTATGGGGYLISSRVLPTTWTRYSCRYTVSATTHRVRVATAFFNHANGAERGAAISIGGMSLRSMASSVLIENGAITADKIATGSITAKHVVAGGITSDKLTVANGFIKSAMIADASITNAKIASLDAAKITTGYLSAARIAAGSITSDKLTVASGFIKTAMIADASITDAKIANLSAAKITSGYIAAGRIAAGSITSDKLTILNGFIKTAMIADAAITNAKIASLDAAKITTGYLSAARIAARSISADKLAANAIQVGLAGWTSSIRISPTQISWYEGTSLEGTITSAGMKFWYGSRFIGRMGQQQKAGNAAIRGISNSLDYQGDYISWSYLKTSTDSSYTTMLTLDPRGKFYGSTGIHLGADLRTHGHNFYTEGNRPISLVDALLTGKGTYPAWAGSSGKAKVVFHSSDLMVVTNGTYYNMSRIVARIGELISRMNTIIGYLNKGWVTSITSDANGDIHWNFYNNTGQSTMPTTLS